MRGSPSGGHSSTPKRLLLIAAISIGFVWVSIALRFRSFEPEPPPPPVSLRAWDFLGCHQLEIESWYGVEEETAPPVVRHLLLLPDSLDEWGREYETYRAVPIGDESGGEGINVRWFTRADTLWFVWSDAVAQGGAALRRAGDRMRGRAVAELRGASTSLEATANAWEVNCHSLRPDRNSPVER